MRQEQGTGIYDLASSLHERVRVFVEDAYPGVHVREIVQRTASTYMPPIHALGEPPPRYILSGIEMTFDVQGEYPELPQSLTCKIVIDAIGQFRMRDIAFGFG